MRLLLARARLRGRLRAGRGARLGRGARIEAAPGARIRLGPGARVDGGARLHALGGEIVLGAGAVVGERCVLVAHERIELGEGAVLGREVAVMDFDHGIADVEAPIRVQGLVTSPVAIEAGAVVGVGAAIQRGVRVGARATVEPRAVVTRDVPPGASVGGVPAR